MYKFTTMDEMIELFKNKKKKGGPYLKDCIQIAALDIILEKDEKDRLAFLSIFCDLAYNTKTVFPNVLFAKLKFNKPSIS